MDITLSDFVDFVLKSGPPKLTKVRQLKARGPYEPAHDYWRTLREGIIEHAESSPRDNAILARVVQEATSPSKATNYPVAVEGYKRFLGRKSISTFEPPRSFWRFDDLIVTVNPELGLIINNVSIVVKLYFKQEPLSSRNIRLAQDLMHYALGDQEPAGARMGVLDVRRSKLYESSAADASLLPLLRAEASAFIYMWRSLEAE